MGDWRNFEHFENRAAVGRALRMRQEIDAFETQWPKREPQEESMPAFSWDQLERQLVDLAVTKTQADMARQLVSASRKLAPFKPPEMVLREILCFTWVLLDENFRAASGTPNTDSS